MDLIGREGMTLVVGIDEVTDDKALSRLQHFSEAAPGLDCLVYWNDSTGLFHPKACYFEGAELHTSIIGSGNLTLGGLRDNYEACTVSTGPPSEMTDAFSAWFSFIERNVASLRPIDEDALARAAKNAQTNKKRRARLRGPSTEGASTGSTDCRVLVAEIPKGGARWKQANFDTTTIQDFFRVGPESRSKQLLFLNEVAGNGSIGESEVRPCVFTQSRNLRIELRAQVRDDYPVTGRPIAVFLELKPRHFAYMILFPGEPEHDLMDSLLAEDGQSPIRRVMTTSDNLLANWEACPLASLLLNEE